MRRDQYLYLIVLLLGTLVAGAPAASAQAGYSPPPVGTQLTWVEGVGEDSRTRVSTVVANGVDFAVYLYDLKWDENQPSSYFAEYSGVHIASCASAQPTQEERNRLRSLWPLQTGRQLTIEAPQSVTYQVGSLEQYTVSQSQGGAETSYRVTSQSGDRKTDLIISLELNTAVQMAWSDGSKVEAVDVFQGTQQVDGTLGQKIGLCRGLLGG